MSKKLFTLVSVILVAAFVLAACAPAATPTPSQPAAPAAPAEPAAPTEPAAPAEPAAPPAEQVTIAIWHQWSGAYLEAIAQAFRDYEAANPGVKIELSNPEDVGNALSVAIPAGEGPDIIGWANDKIGEQALQGNIVPLSDYGIDMAFLQSIYTESGINGVIWQDMIWALPETMEGIALVANNAVVTDEYLPADPFDFDGLLAAAEKFRADTGNALICNQGFGAEDAYHLSPIYFGFGVPSYVDEDGKPYLDTPEAIAAGEWLVKLAAVSLAENSYDICNAALQEGRVGMWWTGPWAIAGIEEGNIDYSVVAMGKPFVGIKTLMLSKNAVDRGKEAAALEVMKYFTSPEVQKKLALVNKTIPAQIAALEDPEVAQLPAVVGFGNALAIGVPMSPSPFSSAQWGPVGRASAAIWTGTQTPEVALKEANAAIIEGVEAMK